MNDGKSDPAGRFWAGTKDDEGRRPLGSLYRLDADRRLSEVLSGVTHLERPRLESRRTNDVLHRQPDVRASTRSTSTSTSGAISNGGASWSSHGRGDCPDGMTVDEEGFLWVAFWGGSAVRRLAPDGSVVSTVGFPVSQVTSCAFGGPDLAELYVTSARAGLSDAELATQPLAGGLFRLRPGVRGLPSPPFAGDRPSAAARVGTLSSVAEHAPTERPSVVAPVPPRGPSSGDRVGRRGGRR